MSNLNSILLIDDSVQILSFLTKVFKNEFEVEYKHDGIAALHYLHEGKLPDLIITDINMPEMDGFKFVKHLKTVPQYNQIPILVLSSNYESADKISMLKLGVDDYVVKPFHMEELFYRVKRVMARSGLSV